MKIQVSFTNELTMHSVKVLLIGALVGALATFFSIFIQTFFPAHASSVIDPATTYERELKVTKRLKPVNEISLPTGAEEITGSDLIPASSYIVTDLSNGEVIAGKNIHSRLPIASLTKVMTAVVALDLASPGNEFAVSGNAAGQIPTKIGMRPGDKLTLSELLKAALLTSANDAAQVIMEGIDNIWGEGTFLFAANQKARLLAMTDSHFGNAEGFDGNNNYSSVYDLALLGRYALEYYPDLSQIVGMDHAFIAKTDTHREIYLNNWNGLLGVYPGVFGLKIGNTYNAGSTAIVASERDGHRILSVVLGAGDIFERDLWSAELLNYGFSRKYNLTPVPVNRTMLQEKYDSWKYFN